MLKWIIYSIAIMSLILWFCGVRAQQVTVYTGPNGQYLGQAVVMSPTQPLPPAYWGPNGR